MEKVVLGHTVAVKRSTAHTRFQSQFPFPTRVRTIGHLGGQSVFVALDAKHKGIERQKALYAQFIREAREIRKAKGLCVWCGNEKDTSTNLCKNCTKISDKIGDKVRSQRYGW